MYPLTSLKTDMSVIMFSLNVPSQLANPPKMVFFFSDLQLHLQHVLSLEVFTAARNTLAHRPSMLLFLLLPNLLRPPYSALFSQITHCQQLQGCCPLMI